MTGDAEQPLIWAGYEIATGEYVVCERGKPTAWLRSDTVVPLPDSDPTDETDERHVSEF